MFQIQTGAAIQPTFFNFSQPNATVQLFSQVGASLDVLVKEAPLMYGICRYKIPDFLTVDPHVSWQKLRHFPALE